MDPDGTWYPFNWNDPAGPPADVDDNPFTFTCSAPGCMLDVVDRYFCGDRFSVTESATTLGQTSVPTTCNAESPVLGDADDAWADPTTFSHGSFWLAPGAHSIDLTTITYGENFGDGGFWTDGSGSLRVRDGVPPPPAAVTSVPTTGEWALILLALGLAGTAALRFKRARTG